MGGGGCGCGFVGSGRDETVKRFLWVSERESVCDRECVCGRLMKWLKMRQRKK